MVPLSTLTDLPVAAAAVLGQTQPPTGPTSPTAGLEWHVRLAINFVVTLVVSAVVAGIVYGVSPGFTEDGVREVREDPVGTFVTGLIANVVIIIATVLLAITIIGLLVVIPGLFVVVFLGIAGNAVGTIALGAALTADDDGVGDAGKSILVGALTLAVVGVIPVVGGIFSFLVSTAGFGYVVDYLLERRRERKNGGASSDAPSAGV